MGFRKLVLFLCVAATLVVSASEIKRKKAPGSTSALLATQPSDTCPEIPGEAVKAAGTGVVDGVYVYYPDDKRAAMIYQNQKADSGVALSDWTDESMLSFTVTHGDKPVQYNFNF